MGKELTNTKVAILVANGFEQSELTVPLERLRAAGARVDIVSPEKGKVKGWKHTDWGDEFDVDVALDDASADDYDALVLPGGQMNPDFLRANDKAVELVRDFVESGKPTAAICHGPWTLVEADVVRGRQLTSYTSIQTDIRNAGGEWVDQEVVVDGNLVTSRKPDDLEAFSGKLIEVILKSATSETSADAASG
jgi:protease I